MILWLGKENGEQEIANKQVAELIHSAGHDIDDCFTYSSSAFILIHLASWSGLISDKIAVLYIDWELKGALYW